MDDVVLCGGTKWTTSWSASPTPTAGSRPWTRHRSRSRSWTRRGTRFVTRSRGPLDHVRRSRPFHILPHRVEYACKLKAHEDNVECAVFENNTSPYAFSCSLDGTVRKWDLSKTSKGKSGEVEGKNQRSNVVFGVKKSQSFPFLMSLSTTHLHLQLISMPTSTDVIRKCFPISPPQPTTRR